VKVASILTLSMIGGQVRVWRHCAGWRRRVFALIVASGLVGRCSYLLSEDLQDGQVIEGMRIINPFTRLPGSVLR
jgi:hypothetical protein